MKNVKQVRFFIRQLMSCISVGHHHDYQARSSISRSGARCCSARSKFHSIEKSINLEAYGAGEIFVSLSRSKLLAGGKLQMLRRKETKRSQQILLLYCVRASLRSVLRKFEKMGSLQIRHVPFQTMTWCATTGNRWLSKHFDRHEAAAQEILESQWCWLVASPHIYLSWSPLSLPKSNRSLTNTPSHHEWRPVYPSNTDASDKSCRSGNSFIVARHYGTRWRNDGGKQKDLRCWPWNSA